MKKEKVTKKIEDQAKIFKSRAKKSAADGKRHDVVQRDEQEWMWIAHKQQGWTFPMIGSVFHRDPRTVEEAVKTYKPSKPGVVRQDLLLTKAREKHLDQIASLLESWEKEVEKARLIKAFAVTYDAEGEALFPYVLQHCPSVSKKYQPLKVERQEYEVGLTRLSEKMARDDPTEATKWFSKVAAHYSVNVALGHSLPSYERSFHGDVGTLWVDNKAIAKGSSEAMERCEELHSELIRNCARSPELSNMVDIGKNLRAMQAELAQVIRDSRLRQEWIDSECDYCPARQGLTTR